MLLVVLPTATDLMKRTATLVRNLRKKKVVTPRARTNLATATKKKTTTSNDEDARGLKEGYRSGLEDLIASQLEEKGIEVSYESFSIPYTQPQKPRKYTPDFPLPNGIIIETKGRFVTADRQKHLWVKEQHPDLDIRFVFSNPNSRIGKKSTTTYAMWCSKNGFKYAKQKIPEEWLKEEPNGKSLAAIKRLTEQ